MNYYIFDKAVKVFCIKDCELFNSFTHNYTCKKGEIYMMWKDFEKKEIYSFCTIDKVYIGLYNCGFHELPISDYFINMSMYREERINEILDESI